MKILEVFLLFYSHFYSVFQVFDKFGSEGHINLIPVLEPELPKTAKFRPSRNPAKPESGQAGIRHIPIVSSSLQPPPQPG